MKSDENLHIKIQRYLEGDMAPEEVAAFEEAMNKDNDLKDQVDIIKKMDVVYSDEDWSHLDVDTTQLKETTALFREKDVQDFSNQIREAQQVYDHQNTPKKKNWLVYISSVAAIVLVSFFGYEYLVSEESMTDLYESYYSESDLPSFAMKSDELDALTRAELLFKEKKFDQSFFLFDSIQKVTQQKNPNLLLFLAQTQSELGNQENALAYLDILAKSNTLDHHKAYWFKAMIYLKNQDKESAIEQLEILTENESYFNHEKAIELLKKLQ